MLKRYTKLIDKLVLIVLLTFISVSCLAQYSTEAPQFQFQSTSTMKTNYEVPALNQYGTANHPYSAAPGRPRRNNEGGEQTRDGNLDNPGGDSTGSLVPVGDIDLVTVLLLLGLGIVIKHTRNERKQKYFGE